MKDKILCPYCKDNEIIASMIESESGEKDNLVFYCDKCNIIYNEYCAIKLEW